MGQEGCRHGCSYFGVLERESRLVCPLPTPCLAAQLPPRCAPLSPWGWDGSHPGTAQSPSASPPERVESAILLRKAPAFPLPVPALCLISCSALFSWETGIWQEGVNRQFNWVFRTKEAVAALSFPRSLTNRQFENHFLPSAQS